MTAAAADQGGPSVKKHKTVIFKGLSVHISGDSSETLIFLLENIISRELLFFFHKSYLTSSPNIERKEMYLA